MKKLYFTVSVCLGILCSSSVLAQTNSKITIGFSNCCKKGTVSTIDQAVEVIEEQAEKKGIKLLYENANEDENIDQTTQLNQVKKMIEQGAQAIILIIVQDKGSNSDSSQKDLVDYIKQKNIPLIAIRRPVPKKLLRNYKKFYSVIPSAVEAGAFQGKMVSDLWKANPSWDKNKDKIMQIAVIKGKDGQPKTEQRTKWAIDSIEKYPGQKVKTQTIVSAPADWNKEKAKDLVSKWIADGSIDNVEVIISNADDMALGAIEAFKEANKPLIPIVGVNAIEDAISSIDKGELSGTVLQDVSEQATIAFTIAENLARKKSAVAGLNQVSIDKNGAVKIPSTIITKDNVDSELSESFF